MVCQTGHTGLRVSIFVDGVAGIEVGREQLYEAVGRAIAHHRSVAGITQVALASQVELSRTSVSNIEAGRQHPPLHKLYEIASVLGVDPRALLPDDPSPDFTPSSRIERYMDPSDVRAVFEKGS